MTMLVNTQVIEKNGARWSALFLIATLFALPLSSTAKSILLSISMISIALLPANRRAVLCLMDKLWVKALLGLFLMACVGCFWGPASVKEKLFVLEKYSKLLYLPFLVIGFKDSKTRMMALHAFLAAMVVTCGMSLVKYWGLSHFHGNDQVFLFRNHIMTSYMMATAAYCSGWLFVRSLRQVVPSWLPAIGYAVLWLLYSYQLFFINSGRTGYVVYILLMILLMTQIFSPRQALLGILLIVASVGASYHFSAIMQQRLHELQQNVTQYHQDKNTNVGYRLQFHAYAYELFKRHPFIGNGTSSFHVLYRQEDPIPVRKNILDPHSQYWLVASEWGLLGFGLFVFFLVSLTIAVWRLPTFRPLGLAIIIPFLTASLTDSMLFYSGTGYFFLMMLALCLSEQ